MKKLLLLAIPLVLTGCGIYGTGQTTGYVYAVDDGIVWDKVWFKTSLESSESDCYLIDNDMLKEQLRTSVGKKTELRYAKHFMTIAICPEGTSTEDEITSFTILE